jgi:predicted alpha/beta superfamily hydrolase
VSRAHIGRRAVLAAAGFAALGPARALAQVVSAGQVTRWTQSSEHVASREIFVWTPPGYERGRGRYGVLYMHDGQNLYDASMVGFGEEWGVDETVSTLIEAGALPNLIVVGVGNTPARGQEYQPETLVRRMPDRIQPEIARQLGGPAMSAAYLRFLVEELRPRIAQEFRVRTDRAHTAVMGSSMGGLISLEAVATYPEVFAAAGCVSTHWPLRREPFPEIPALLAWQHDVMAGIAAFVTQDMPQAGRTRIYFDAGTAGVDAYYAPFQAAADAALQQRGWRHGRDFVSLRFDAADHNEAAWKARLSLPLQFLLG